MTPNPLSHTIQGDSPLIHALTSGSLSPFPTRGGASWKLKPFQGTPRLVGPIIPALGLGGPCYPSDWKTHPGCPFVTALHGTRGERSLLPFLAMAAIEVWGNHDGIGSSAKRIEKPVCKDPRTQPLCSVS